MFLLQKVPYIFVVLLMTLVLISANNYFENVLSFTCEGSEHRPQLASSMLILMHAGSDFRIMFRCDIGISSL